jgi:hypothetical protein
MSEKKMQVLAPEGQDPRSRLAFTGRRQNALWKEQTLPRAGISHLSYHYNLLCPLKILHTCDFLKGGDLR